MRKVAIVGGGKFGLAIAYACGKSESNLVSLFSRRDEIINHINQHGTHPDFEQYNMHVFGSPSLEDAIGDADFIFIAVSSEEFVTLVEAMKGVLLGKSPVFIICTKGINYHHQNMFFSDLLQHTMPESEIAVLSGPSFATEILHGVATGVSLGCNRQSLASNIDQILEKSSIRIQHINDIRAVQLLGAYKNVIGLRIGMEEGFIESMLLHAPGVGNSCRNKVASIFCELTQEAGELLVSIGSSREELLSYAGLGDMVLTAYSQKSRNMSLGKNIGIEVFNQLTKKEKQGRNVAQDFVSNLHFFEDRDIEYASIIKNLFTQSETTEGKYATAKLFEYSQVKKLSMSHLLFLHKVMNSA